MAFVQLLPVGLSGLVLAAHFLRGGNLVLLVATLAMSMLLFVRRWWAARLMQAGLLCGTVVWLHSLVVLVTLRIRNGEPFERLAVILGTVATVTAASALLFRTRTLRRRFELSGSTEIA